VHVAVEQGVVRMALRMLGGWAARSAAQNVGRLGMTTPNLRSALATAPLANGSKARGLGALRAWSAGSVRSFAVSATANAEPVATKIGGPVAAAPKGQPKKFDKRGGKNKQFNNRSMLISRVLSVDSVRKTTKGGRVNRFRALVACGNGNGAAGFAYGKADTVRKAVQKAYNASKKRWVVLERREDKGLYHDVVGEFNSTKVIVRSCEPFKGLKAGRVVRGICEVFGIENAVSKIIGPRTVTTVVNATFHALSQHRTPQEMSRARGRRLLRASRWKML